MTGSERRYATLRALVHAHHGRPAVVMGGGPSLPTQLEQCPPRLDAVYISANHHGAALAGADFIVALDKIEVLVRPFGVPIVTRHMYGDYRLLTTLPPNSGIAAAFVARALGCAPIYLVGMDLGGAYWNDGAAKSGGTFSRADHLNHWRDFVAKYPAEYRTSGGPLAGALESRPGPVPIEELLLDVAGVSVRFVEHTPHRGRWFQQGESAELNAREAEKLLAARKVVYL